MRLIRNSSCNQNRRTGTGKKSLAFLLHWFPKKQVLKLDSNMKAMILMIRSAIGQDGFPVCGSRNRKTYRFHKERPWYRQRQGPLKCQLRLEY